MAPKRVFGRAGVCASAVMAGTIDSRNGRPTATPRPRRKSRRGRARLVMNIGCDPVFRVLRSRFSVRVQFNGSYSGFGSRFGSAFGVHVQFGTEPEHEL